MPHNVFFFFAQPQFISVINIEGIVGLVLILITLGIPGYTWVLPNSMSLDQIFTEDITLENSLRVWPTSSPSLCLMYDKLWCFVALQSLLEQEWLFIIPKNHDLKIMPMIYWPVSWAVMPYFEILKSAVLTLMWSRGAALNSLSTTKQ